VSEVVIVDSGGANLASLTYAFDRLDCRTILTTDGSTIASAERVVLPGVGAAGHVMRRLRESGLLSVLLNLTQPVLGICLGMQLLFERSDEDATTGLSIFPGVVQKLRSSPKYPVPHMGWNELEDRKPDPLLTGLPRVSYAYFVHSYAAPVSELTLASTKYATAISAVVRRRNFWGTQFHPERSGSVGAKLLDNFLKVEL
jgi:imidazole glycerol-phosphate synthase subunit HisH